MRSPLKLADLFSDCALVPFPRKPDRADTRRAALPIKLKLVESALAPAPRAALPPVT